MYKISVPVMNYTLRESDREKILQKMQSMGVERVFLALKPYLLDLELREKEFSRLRGNIRFFKEKGLEVGVWLWAFMIETPNEYGKMRSLAGYDIGTEVCPLDPDFARLAQSYVKDIVAAGADMLMYDDDFRFGFLGAEPCCVCKYHLEKIGEILGRNVSEEEVRANVLLGKGNDIRDAFLKANGDALQQFATKMRAVVDEINPKVRMGISSCMSSWDVDGGNEKEIDKILAGGNQPFRRLSGAPYWAVKTSWGNRLCDVVELERMERSYFPDEWELFSEGDVWPRPRTACPASFLEIFDTVLRADGGNNGILKYVFDYTSSVEYENGYIDMHLRNQPIYKEIDELFVDKKCVGVRVYESARKLGRMEINRGAVMDNAFFPSSARLLARNGIPTQYDGEGICGIAFGVSILDVDPKRFKKGIILDETAAKILESQGYDTGVERRGDVQNNTVEYYGEECVSLGSLGIGSVDACRTELKKGAKAHSYFAKNEYDDGRIVATHSYVNEKGDKFFIFDFPMLMQIDEVLRSYARSKQIASVIEEVFGNKLPAYTYGHPDLYLLAKKGTDGSMAVGIWNIFADPVYEAVIALDGVYKSLRTTCKEVRLDGDKVYISKIPAYEFVLFEVQ